MTDSFQLSAVAADYDAILCDVWGVIRGGHDLVPSAIEALQRFRAQGGTVVLLSNSPRRASSLLNFLKDMGAPDYAWDDAVTSGEATFSLLTDRAPGPAYKIGAKWDEGLYEGSGLEFAPLDKARFVSCTGLVDYPDDHPDRYEDTLREAQLRGLTMICANPDIVVRQGDKLAWCAGALAQRFEEMGGEVILPGKPNPPIYDLAYSKIETIRGATDKSRILAIGDGPQTDIAGAVREDLDVLFIAAGIVEDQMGGSFSEDTAQALLAERKLTARHVAPVLEW
ncbi:TIGR01459 family HAD-type hydrolase [Maricaulaceae bacterium EIL42A08]|nr:TIGR01459 family HAD-type hydrolase [Maricaulaceae bacterium EIL42A08]MCP2678071.1 TIGR01459 family HAD-type hydrolase [Maricaulaceae bacterium NA33B04]